MLSAPSSDGAVGGPEQVAVEVDAHPLVRVRAVAVGELEPVVDPAVLGRERGDAAHRRVDVQPHVLAPADLRRSPASGRTPSTTSCRGWRRRRTARARRRGRRRSSSASASGRIANVPSWARCGSGRCRCRRCAGPSRCSSGPATWRRRRAVVVSPSVLTAPPVARHRADRMATSVASLAEPWITPPPVRARRAERARGGRAARPSSRASASRARCTPATSPSSCPARRVRPSAARRGSTGTRCSTGSRRRSSGAASG